MRKALPNEEKKGSQSPLRPVGFRCPTCSSGLVFQVESIDCSWSSLVVADDGSCPGHRVGSLPPCHWHPMLVADLPNDPNPGIVFPPILTFCFFKQPHTQNWNEITPQGTEQHGAFNNNKKSMSVAGCVATSAATPTTAYTRSNVALCYIAPPINFLCIADAIGVLLLYTTRKGLRYPLGNLCFFYLFIFIHFFLSPFLLLLFVHIIQYLERKKTRKHFSLSTNVRLHHTFMDLFFSFSFVALLFCFSKKRNVHLHMQLV